MRPMAAAGGVTSQRKVSTIIGEASGVADLPLHGGACRRGSPTGWSRSAPPSSRASSTTTAGRRCCSRLSDPFWFQALGSVMGMDWHSSGITTSVMGALKKGLNPRAHELGVYVCGGRGRQSRKTPDELRAIADRISLDGDALVRTSRLTARIDNNADRRRLPDLPARVRRSPPTASGRSCSRA